MIKNSVLIIFWIPVFFLFAVRCKKTDSQKASILYKDIPTVGALPKQVKYPDDNPQTPDKIALGKLLFYDPILSGNKDVSCATCHHPNTGYAEFLDISIGVNGKGLSGQRSFKTPNTIPFVKRNAHTILNTAFNGIDEKGGYDPKEAPMFWDLRTKGLENQSLEPIKSFEEMRGEHFKETEILEEIVNRLNTNEKYVNLFKKAFPKNSVVITIKKLGKAIASFERSLVTNNSRFDQYMRGDSTAISLTEKEGFKLFKEVGCINCHKGPMFSDYLPHVLGVPDNKKLDKHDKGISESFSFRTPTLRNLLSTAPYMHNGTLKTLKQVLEFYDDNTLVPKNANVNKEDLDPLLKKLTLKSINFSPILSFINTLNDSSFDKTIPESVPSGLPVGGDIH